MVSMSIKRYRYRAYPTKDQRQAITDLFGCVRVVYNDALEYALKQYKVIGKTPSRKVLSARLTQSQKTEERYWLNNVSAVPLQQSLNDLDTAYSNFFASIDGKRNGTKFGAPKFKKRSSRQTARFTSRSFKVRQTSHGVGFVRLSKIGYLRFVLSRELPSSPSSVTLIQESDGNYYVSFVVRTTPPSKPKPIAYAVGVDMGLKNLAITVNSNADSQIHANPRPLQNAENKLKKLQKQLSRKTKGSNRYTKQRIRLTKAYAKVRNTRTHYLHQVANRIVDENQIIALETLSITGLVKTKLGKSILDASRGQLNRLIEEKATDRGRTVLRIDRFAPTTQTCSICETPNDKKPLNVRNWICIGCNNQIDRDLNAAVNIMLAAGLAESLNEHCGDNIRRRLADAVIVDTVNPPRVPTF